MRDNLGQDRYQRLQEKWQYLYKDYDLETRSEEKLRLRSLIDDVEKELEQLQSKQGDNSSDRYAAQKITISGKRMPILVFLLVLVVAIIAWQGWQHYTRIPVGETLLLQGEYQQAQQECQAAPASTDRERCLRITNLMLEPRDVETFYAAANPEDSAYALAVMGEAEASREDFSTAEKHYRDAIQRNPAMAQAYFGMGQIYQMQNRAAEALDWYKQVVDHAPNNRRFLLNLASVYAEQGQLPAAETHYRKVLALDNSTLLAYAELLDVLLKQQKIAEARELVNVAQQGLANNPAWKSSPLNQETWFVMQDGKPAYLESWEQKQAYLNAQFQKVAQP